MVLEYWAVRKKQQDACMQFVQYEASAKQVCNLHHLTYLTHYSSGISPMVYSLAITPILITTTLSPPPPPIIIMDSLQKIKSCLFLLILLQKNTQLLVLCIQLSQESSAHSIFLILPLYEFITMYTRIATCSFIVSTIPILHRTNSYSLYQLMQF